jgi:hypothetical protein
MITLKNIFKKLKGNNLSGQIDRAKCFGEDLNYNGPFEYIDLGVGNVLLNQIVGSVGKCSAFSIEFIPRSHVPKDRLINIKQAIRNGKSLPPVNLYKVDDEYYVMDGNHRVAAAKAFGHRQILAKVVELIPSN